RRTGRFIRLPSPHDASVHPDMAEANRLPTSRIIGATEDVVTDLRDLARRTGAQELMVTSVAYDLAARLRSLELLAGAWPLAPLSHVAT
ncbi:MAG: alkanal monooxygenase, partial [Actinomycetota bacterium]